MTQEDKDLLLKDLCARLPYKPIVHIDDCGIWDLRGIDHDDSAELRDRVIVWHGENYPSSKNSFPIINCKPYLFPLSSMTESQNDSWRDTWFPDLMISTDVNYPESEKYLVSSHVKSLQWLYENHFDINGLIDKGLALDATDKNIY